MATKVIALGQEISVPSDNVTKENVVDVLQEVFPDVHSKVIAVNHAVKVEGNAIVIYPNEAVLG